MRKNEMRFKVLNWVDDNQTKLFGGLVVIAFAGMLLTAGFIWGKEANKTPIVTSPIATVETPINVYTIALTASDTNKISLRGNPENGEVECRDEYGIVKAVGSYSANLNGMNITSSRRLSLDGSPHGGMTHITMDMVMVSCVGHGTWFGQYSNNVK